MFKVDCLAALLLLLAGLHHLAVRRRDRDSATHFGDNAVMNGWEYECR